MMIINARVETDLGLIGERLLEGRVPPEGDDSFYPACRVILGRTGSSMLFGPFIPTDRSGVPPYLPRIQRLIAGLPDPPPAYPNVLPLLPPDGPRTYAALIFYEDGGGREFVRFAWRKDIGESHAAMFFKDAWYRRLREISPRSSS